MNQFVKSFDLNRTVLWIVPFLAIAFFVQNNFGTGSFNVKEVSVSEAKSLIDSGAIVVDVREPEAFKNRHLPGAVSIPLSQLRNGVPASLSTARDQSIVVYCGDGSTIGPEGTRTLNDAGYGRAVNMKSGIQGWKDAGHPIEGSMK